MSLVMATSALFWATLVVYVAPVAALLGGAFLGQGLAERFSWDPDGSAALFGLGFLAAALLVVRVAGRGMGRRKSFSPRMGRIVRRACPEPGGRSDT